MKKYIKIISVVLIVLVLAGLGIGYGFFNYTRTGGSQKLIAGSLYLTMNEGEDTINLNNVFPETKEEARSHGGNTLTFTLKGKNTSTNKAINYEILLNNGAVNNEKTTRYDTKDLVFDLVEIGANNEETYILDAVSYDTLENQKIWVDKIAENTNSEIEKTYKLRVWISDNVVISETDPNRDYTPDEFKNGYASIKVAVEGDLEDKELPLLVNNSGVLNVNNETEVSNEIQNNEDSEVTYTLLITSSNSNVEFVYDGNSTVSNISSSDIKGELSNLTSDVNPKVSEIDEEVVSDSFNKNFTIAANKKVTFTFSLRSKTGNEEVTDLNYTLKKGNEVVQELVKHITVVGYEKDVPKIEFVNKEASYTGSGISLDNVVIKNSDDTTYTGDASYTYYKGNDCTGQQLSSAPIIPGVYSEKVYVSGAGNDGDTSRCGTITISKKTITPSINSCNNKTYDGTTSANCTITLSGIVGNEKVSTSGVCAIDSANAGTDKDVTCSNLTLTGNDKNNYTLSSTSTSSEDILDIEKAILIVTADNKSVEYGQSIPSYTYTISGFVNNETESVLGGTVSYATMTGNTTIDNLSSLTAGSYTIIPSGLTSDNYSINYINGTLNVTVLYTVTYDYSTNGGTSATATTASVYNDADVDLTPTATKEGWTFVGWNTTPSATVGLSSLKMTRSDLTLYAIYGKTITATFNKNGAATQTNAQGVAVDDSSVTKNCTIYNNGTSCTIKSPTIVSVSGFDVIGYNTSSDGTTSEWNHNTDKADMTSNVTYYAITRSTSPVTITFNKNGNTSQTPSGGSASSENTITQSCYKYNGAGTCLITSPSFVSPSATPTHIGYSGASDSYTNSWTEDTSVGVSIDATYYAQSTAVALTYSVTYDNNGATSGGASNTSCDIAATYNGTIQPTTCSITTAAAPTKTYNMFTGWKSSTDNNVYNALANYDVTADTTLTAQWQGVWAEHLSYDNTNGPSGCTGDNANAQCAIDAIYDILNP